MISRKAKLRRFVYYMFIFTIIIYISAVLHHYIYNNYSNILKFIQSIPPYNKYINQNGTYLPYCGYKILQFIKNPNSNKLNNLYAYLDRQNELKLYFMLVPQYTYHVTLTNLKNQTSYNKKYLEILKKEQVFLDIDDIYTTCIGKQLLIINKNEIRMEIELTNDYIDNKIKLFQKRWNENFPKLIIQHYTSFYITLAYQYKDIPNNEVFNQLDNILKEWKELPVDIELDPIEICSYTNLISYKAILPDVYI